MTYPPGPPGPPYGYGYPPPPPPPQPGVIPLAPLRFGAILTGAFTTIGRYWKQLLGVTGAVYGGALLVVGAALGIAYAAVGDLLPAVFDLPEGQEPRWDDVRPLVTAFVCVWIVALVVMVCATTVVAAACPAVVQEAVLGRPTTFGAVWRRSWSRMPAVLGTVVLTSLALVIPMALFVAAFVGLVVALLLAADDATGTPVGGLLLAPLVAIGLALLIAPLALWIWVKFSLAPAAAVVEGQGAFASMRRSSSLVRGSWWRVFGCLLAAGLMAAVVSGFIQQLLSMLVSAPLSATDLSGDDRGALIASLAVLVGALAIGQMITQAVVSLFPPIVTALLYIDQRIRRENLAPELARAAGLL
ncbi:oxidoreductase [Streptomyces sp. NK15101]|uniref:oxidoreductase n=1 Tax=Streptomyces sp. NK15101 TaxID=2873261 RepID=UPI001CEC5BE4|nr:oxidoreductase [Streptomyces sp. NK15101]